MASPLVRLPKSLFWDIEAQQLIEKQAEDNNQTRQEEKEEAKAEAEAKDDVVTVDLTDPINTFPAGITFMRISQHLQLLAKIKQHFSDRG
jgi:hypothetical protein